MKKDFKLEDIFLYFYILLFVAGLTSILNYSSEKKDLDKISNDFHGPYSIFFKVKSEDFPKNKLERLLMDKKNGGYILFKENISQNKKIFGFFNNGDVEVPPIVSGRFFENKDYFHNKKKAVIGQNVKTTNLKGLKCFVFQGNCFEVIGVMGAGFKSNLDEFVYLNLDGVNDVNGNIAGTYVLDKGKKNNDGFYTKILKLKDTLKLSILDIEKKGTSRVFSDLNNSSIFILSLFIFLFIIKNTLVLYYWLYKKRIEVSIQYLIGTSINQILLDLFKKFVMKISGAYLASVLIVALWINKTICFLISMSFYFGLLFCFNALCFLIYSVKVNKKIFKVLK
ncbi:ABC transporter permease [Bacillus inaquosorum]|uniref:hypothetical protein n=1 Tax=Bacillus inaquosorum TaxID=483913 RepID=UPI003F15459B